MGNGTPDIARLRLLALFNPLPHRAALVVEARYYPDSNSHQLQAIYKREVRPRFESKGLFTAAATGQFCLALAYRAKRNLRAATILPFCVGKQRPFAIWPAIAANVSREVRVPRRSRLRPFPASPAKRESRCRA